MNIVNLTVTQPVVNVPLGRRGENAVREIRIDYSAWASEFGPGVCTLLVRRSLDASAYPVAMTYDGDVAIWTVSEIDTQYVGNGKAEYVYTVDRQIAKSAVFGTVVLPDIGEPSATPPDPYETWLEALTELEAVTLQNAQDAQAAADDAAGSLRDAQTAQAAAESAQGLAEAAQGNAEDAQAAAEAAQSGAESDALKAEGYAIGTQDGVPVSIESPYYHANASYWAAYAAQAAEEGGYVQFYIDADGCLNYVKTTNLTELDFSLVNGDLLVEVG